MPLWMFLLRAVWRRDLSFLPLVLTVAVVSTVHAATDVWTATPGTTAIDGSGTWDTSTPNWITGGISGVFTPGDSVVFGTGSSSTGSGVAVITDSGALTTGTITFNAPAGGITGWQLTGGGALTLPGSGTVPALLVQGTGTNVEIDDNLADLSGATNLYIQNAGTGVLTLKGITVYGDTGPLLSSTSTGSISLQGVAFTAKDSGEWLQLRQGTFTITNAATTYNTGGTTYIGTTTAATTLTISNGGSYAATGAIGLGKGGGTATLNVATGGTLNANGDLNGVGNGDVNATGILNISGGTVNVASGRYLYVNQYNNINGTSGTVNLSGGTLSTYGIDMGGGNATTTTGTNHSILNISGGQLIFLGNGGGGAAIHTGAYNSNAGSSGTTATDTQVNLSGGTLIAGNATAVSWNSAMNMTLSTGANGNVTFQTSNLANTTGATVTLSGILSGSGGLTKSGLGTLVLSNVGNTYSGLTQVTAGTLSAASLGGSVEVGGGATLILTAAGMGSGASLILDAANAAVQFNFAGADSINSLEIAGVWINPGTYTASQLGSEFSGTGSLTIAAAPEPGTWALLLGGGLLLARLVRRRPAQA